MCFRVVGPSARLTKSCSRTNSISSTGSTGVTSEQHVVAALKQQFVCHVFVQLSLAACRGSMSRPCSVGASVRHHVATAASSPILALLVLHCFRCFVVLGVLCVVGNQCFAVALCGSHRRSGHVTISVSLTYLRHGNTHRCLDCTCAMCVVPETNSMSFFQTSQEIVS